VPFIYLRSPTDGQVGPYAAIAVYGATNWAEPVWFGRPVQWCGLVYADALYRLAEHQPTGPWKHLADGITACAIQQCWPASDPQRQGLLPDFYHLRAQTSDGPAINPATLQANAVRLFGGPKVYDFHRFPRHGLLVHAPGRIEPIEEGEAGVRFGVSGWPREPYWVLIAGARRPLQIRVNGAKPAPEVVQQDVTAGRIVLRLTGNSTIDLASDEKR
jgi:hypothetical protein